jgi:hypothetical protein
LLWRPSGVERGQGDDCPALTPPSHNNDTAAIASSASTRLRVVSEAATTAERPTASIKIAGIRSDWKRRSVFVFHAPSASPAPFEQVPISPRRSMRPPARPPTPCSAGTSFSTFPSRLGRGPRSVPEPARADDVRRLHPHIASVSRSAAITRRRSHSARPTAIGTEIPPARTSSAN